MTITIGVDAHSRNHCAAALDEQGRVVSEIAVEADPAGLRELLEWMTAMPAPRRIAIENARGYGLAIVERLVSAGEQVIDIPGLMTRAGRRASGQRGKSDRGDAIAVALVALREPQRFATLEAEGLDEQLKLLVDARQQLIAESARWRNRVHALLRVASPGYQELTGALASPGAVRRARVVARRARAHDPCARSSPWRRSAACSSLRRTPMITSGVSRGFSISAGPLSCGPSRVSARSWPPASSARPAAWGAFAAPRPLPHTPEWPRSASPAVARTVTASTAAATVSPTWRSTPSRWFRRVGIPTHGPTSTVSAPRERAPARPAAA